MGNGWLSETYIIVPKNDIVHNIILDSLPGEFTSAATTTHEETYYPEEFLNFPKFLKCYGKNDISNKQL